MFKEYCYEIFERFSDLRHTPLTGVYNDTKLSGTESRIANRTIPSIAGRNRQKFRSEKQKIESNRSKVESRKIESESPFESHPNNAQSDILESHDSDSRDSELLDSRFRIADSVPLRSCVSIDFRGLSSEKFFTPKLVGTNCICACCHGSFPFLDLPPQIQEATSVTSKWRTHDAMNRDPSWVMSRNPYTCNKNRLSFPS